MLSFIIGVEQISTLRLALPSKICSAKMHKQHLPHIISFTFLSCTTTYKKKGRCSRPVVLNLFWRCTF